MQKRECSKCGGELVLAMRANQLQTVHSEPGQPVNSFTTWRCGTCGGVFSAAQLRDDKRQRLRTAQHAGAFSGTLRS